MMMAIWRYGEGRAEEALNAIKIDYRNFIQLIFYRFMGADSGASSAYFAGLLIVNSVFCVLLPIPQKLGEHAVDKQ